MYSDKVRTNTATAAAAIAPHGSSANVEPAIKTNGQTARRQQQREVFDKWHDWHASEISHHGDLCCEIAREWITATDFSELAAGAGGALAGPRWLRQRFNWGASSFPIFWCEAVRKKTLDCGALAALAHEVFKTRGVKSYRVQMVQRFSRTATAQWGSSWNTVGGAEPLRWTNGDLIYHEGCAIAPRDDEQIKIWDASAGWWVDPISKDGYGALLAVRVTAPNLPPAAPLMWGAHRINAGQWTRIV